MFSCPRFPYDTHHDVCDTQQDYNWLSCHQHHPTRGLTPQLCVPTLCIQYTVLGRSFQISRHFFSEFHTRYIIQSRSWWWLILLLVEVPMASNAVMSVPLGVSRQHHHHMLRNQYQTQTQNQNQAGSSSEGGSDWSMGSPAHTSLSSLSSLSLSAAAAAYIPEPGPSSRRHNRTGHPSRSPLPAPPMKSILHASELVSNSNSESDPEGF